jgi:imidazolonepropionase-like amidohydrolase
MRRFLLLLLLVSPCVFAADGDPAAPEKPKVTRVLVVGATVHLADGTAQRADVLIEDGTVTAVGVDLDAKDAERVEAKGRVLIPGLIDARSGLFVTASERGSGQACYRVADAIDPYDRDAPGVLARGVTTVVLAPGWASTWGGRPAVVKLDDPSRVLDVHPGILATVGATRKRRAPTALTLRGEWSQVGMMLGRAKAGQMLRKKYAADLAKFKKAHAAWEKIAAAAKKKKAAPPKEPGEPRPPRPDANIDALIPLLEGDAPLRLEVHGARAILDAVSLARQAQVHLVLEGCTGIAEVAADLPPTVPIVLAVHRGSGPPEAKPEPANAVALAEANVPFAIASFGETGLRSRHLLDLAALCVREGLSRERALRAITADAARACGLGDRVGRIEKGFDADMVCLDGDPFSSSTKVLWVMIGGRIVYRRDS